MSLFFPTKLSSLIGEYLGETSSPLELKSAITNFFEGVKSPADKEENFLSKMSALWKERENKSSSFLKEKRTIRSVAILGAGPAGLIRAIIATLSGTRTTVIEKRQEDQDGRLNGIMLTSETVEILNKYGIYHYLEERKLFGSSPNTDRFPVSVSIKHLETAMKAVLFAIVAENNPILYKTSLEHISKRSDGLCDLLLKVGQQKKQTLSRIDLVIVAEGGKSETATSLLDARRVVPFPPHVAIGGVFKSMTGRKSFSIFKENVLSSVVLVTPGQCSIGYVPLDNKKTEVKNLARLTEKEETPQSERKKKELFQGCLNTIFSADAASGQEAPNLDQNIFIRTAMLQSDFTLPFSRKINTSSLFILSGDALSQVDATSGRGANNAIEWSEDLVGVLESSKNVDLLATDYAKKTKERVDNSMRKIRCLRSATGMEIDQKAYDFACFQLKHYELTTTIQNIFGATLSNYLLNTRLGEKCFRYLAEKFASSEL